MTTKSEVHNFTLINGGGISLPPLCTCANLLLKPIDQTCAPAHGAFQIQHAAGACVVRAERLECGFLLPLWLVCF